MPGRGRNGDSWGILAECQASLSLEQFLGKMKSSWRRGSRVISNILSSGSRGRRYVYGRGGQGVPEGEGESYQRMEVGGRCCPTDMEKDFWDFRAMEQQDLAPRL